MIFLKSSIDIKAIVSFRKGLWSFIAAASGHSKILSICLNTKWAMNVITETFEPLLKS